MVTAAVDTSRLSARISEFIGATGKQVAEEMTRQGKFLAYELAAQAPPASKKQSNGLSPGNRTYSESKIKRSLEFFIRRKTYEGGTWATAQVAAENDPAALQAFAASGDWYKGATSGTALSASASGAGSVIMRIMKAAQANPALALKNLRQYLKNQIADIEARYAADFKNDPTAIVKAYYEAIGKRANRQRSRVVKVAGPQGGEGNTVRARAAIRRAAFARIGQVKAGWVQSGDALPAQISISSPSWLSGKRTVGRGNIQAAGLQATVTLGNANGNPAGLETRTRYVQRAVDRRERAVKDGMEHAILAQARKSFK